jgi:nucleotide-binding universal stress UspA family protein
MKNQEAPIAVWAINPFEDETRPGPETLRELRAWAQAQGIRLQPTYVLYVSNSDMAPVNGGTWVRRFAPAIEREANRYLEGMNLPTLMPPKILIQRGGFTGETVDTLLRYAQDLNAAWLITSSKGRSGARRMVLGSFAETLLARSPLPVWVFGHADSVPALPLKILFPTDFSDLSRAAFKKVVEQAGKLEATIRLFHSVRLPESVGVVGVYQGFAIEDFLQDQASWAKTEGKTWQAFGQSHDVRVELEIDRRSPDLAKAVVDSAQREHAGIIALASSSGPLSAVLLGSQARQIIRQSGVPVWAFGPRWSVAEPMSVTSDLLEARQ